MEYWVDIEKKLREENEKDETITKELMFDIEKEKENYLNDVQKEIRKTEQFFAKAEEEIKGDACEPNAYVEYEVFSFKEYPEIKKMTEEEHQLYFLRFEGAERLKKARNEKIWELKEKIAIEAVEEEEDLRRRKEEILDDDKKRQKFYEKLEES